MPPYVLPLRYFTIHFFKINTQKSFFYGPYPELFKMTIALDFWTQKQAWQLIFSLSTTFLFPIIVDIKHLLFCHGYEYEPS